MEQIIFYIFGAGAVLSALIMVTNKKPVSAAFSLIVTMFCLAGLYVLLDAHLIAALQVIVYAGAIMVLFLFVIMLLNIQEKEGRLRGKILFQSAGILIVGYVFIKVVKLIGGGDLPAKMEGAIQGFGTTKVVGLMLFTDFLFPFEIASILLLAAI
ncbi:MAG: NADH-quinone oxidoreductase subunit J, partial [Nitrospinae bacterium]|nr:NADH-quinone oxidoreductase subunit J [Nitrospinota bacterium]